jgi:hypothetical protein
MTAFRWPFADGFASRIGSDPPPESWVRDWRWLLENVGEPAQAYIEEMEERGLGPVFGRNLCADFRVALAPVPDAVVRAEFATQEIVFVHDRVRYRLAVADGSVDGPCPITADVGFLSLTRRVEGAPQTDVLWSAPPDWPVIGAIDADRRWTDQMAAGEPEAVWARARETDQLCYVRWRVGPGHGCLDVVDIATGDVTASGPARLSRAILTCPLIPAAPCGQLCRLYGGPWVGRSIHAAARWSANHANRLVDVGCDTCGDGSVMVGPMAHGQPRLYAGWEAPGAIDVKTGREMVPQAGRTRWSDWPADNRYGSLVTVET